MMGICSTVLQALVNAGRDIDVAIEVAEAMERGPDASVIYSLFDSLLDAGANDSTIADAVIETAQAINQRNKMVAERFARRKDECTGLKDSNRVRRGLSDSKWRVLRQQIFERDNHECQYCGASDDLTCDHIVPLMRGGTNDNENLNTACRSCNSSKGDKLLDEWRPM